MASEDRGDLIAPDELQIARNEWDRLQYAIDNGHSEFVDKLRRNYRYWKGDGGQWNDADRDYMESVQGRKCIEINGILPAVSTAVGEQIATRVDISYKPKRGKASQETAVILSKVAKHDLSRNNYPRIEKQLFRDGLIKQRGFIDVRMNFDENLFGDVQIRELDPVCVIPGPASTSYDPIDWPEVTVLRWLSLDQIEGMYGTDARNKVERTHAVFDENPYNDLFRTVNNLDSRFGFSPRGLDTHLPPHRMDGGEMRYRIIERQFYKMVFSLHWVDLTSGEVSAVPPSMRPEQYKAIAAQFGYSLQRINKRRVHWRVCTALTVLHDTISPYRSYTVIPFFYLFDYGDTLGMVDNLISPTDLQNKAITSELHILTSLSNSGWKVPHDGEKSTLINMTGDELRNVGMKNGLVLDYDKTIGEPEKILPNNPPVGFDRLSQKGEHFIKTVSGMSDAEQGLNSPEVSGVAIEAKQFQSKLGLADPLDNLQTTRVLLGRKILELRQDFTTSEQAFVIVGTDKQTGKPTEETVVVNQVDPMGRVLNDITIGEYDVEVSTSPMAATHDESQFRQALEMRKSNIPVPDATVIRLSNLDDKYEIAEQMSQPNVDPVKDAEAALAKARANLADAQAASARATATNTNVQALFGSITAAERIALIPGVTPIADELALSAGFEDRNASPLIPLPAPPAAAAMAGQVAAVPPVPENTSPTFPPQADSGVNAGIEGGGV